MLTASQIVQLTSNIPSLTSQMERAALTEVAMQAPAGSRILEIGSLYGGTTALLAMAAPDSFVFTVDDFKWFPEDWGHGPTSPEALTRNLHGLDIHNFEIIQGDSRTIPFNRPIYLLWIDGGHSYEFVKSDLDRFGILAEVIALHDWDNPTWPTIRQAVEDFIKTNPEWQVEYNVEMVVVLRRKK